MAKLLSASRLNAFLACAHQAALWLDGVEPPDQDDPQLELVRSKGFEHEALVLAALEDTYGKAVSITGKGTLDHRVAETAAAISAEAPLIYQGALVSGRWVGFPDFLVRTIDRDGRARYEPEDAKLSRKAKAEHVLQLGIYAELIRQLTGSPAENGAIHVGKGRAERFRLKRTEHITRRMMERFEKFASSTSRATRAIWSTACGQCAYLPRCEAEWRSTDSLIFVAGLRVDQQLKLEAAGVPTLTALAAHDASKSVPGIGQETLGKLIHQARLQAQAREGSWPVDVLPVEPGRGFAVLPEPRPGDLFFDMEGDPLYPEGLEYLFGLWGPLGVDGADRFQAIWAHDRAAEKAAFEALMDLFCAHLARFPEAHIYHYAPYEVVALKRLAQRHATREAELDDFLREHRFVDLFRVVRQAIRASTEGYSLKNLEKIYWGERSGTVTNAGDSIVQYEHWRETGDDTILEDIGHYNKEDCVSTARLRDWLETMRPAGGAYELTQDETDEEVSKAERSAERIAFENERRQLAAAVRNANGVTDRTRNLIAELLWFHQRAQKPQWWALFDRQTWSDEELIDDFESLGGLTLDPERPVYRDKQSLVATYLFDAQDTKLKEGDRVRIALTLESAGTIAELDSDAGRVVVRRTAKAGDYPERCALIPGQLIDQEVLVRGVMAFARRVVTGAVDGDRALVGLLERACPTINGVATDTAILQQGEALLPGTVRAVSNLNGSYIVIQGPPGTGKTYTISHAILALLNAGKRVAVSSNSHKAIHNVLAAVEARARESGSTFCGAKRATKGNTETVYAGDFITPVFKSEEITGEFRLVGATAFHFARPDEIGAYDYLVVDEAGQVALGNLVAMAGCARNIVLVGDQMQLPQPVQGTHPEESGTSCLEYLMQAHATVPAERGILLDISWRMHSAVCQFISDAIYDGRLVSHPDASKRRLILKPGAHSALRPVGLSVIEVEHAGCTQSSAEEAAVVAAVLQSVLHQSVTETDGQVRPIILKDVLVVAPFNAQVNLLGKFLPGGTRIGTVDKFQGQEAAVVIVSMATSDGATAPRGTDFLFNTNRLNVAISRAKCLAVLVRSRNLLESTPGTIDDLYRLDAFARLDVAANFSASARD